MRVAQRLAQGIAMRDGTRRMYYVVGAGDAAQHSAVPNEGQRDIVASGELKGALGKDIRAGVSTERVDGDAGRRGAALARQLSSTWRPR